MDCGTRQLREQVLCTASLHWRKRAPPPLTQVAASQSRAYDPRLFRRRPGRLLFLLRALQAGVASRRKLVLKLLDSPSRVDVLQLPCKEGMAQVADVDLQFLPCTSSRKLVSATASDSRIDVVWMNAVLHCRFPAIAVAQQFGPGWTEFSALRPESYQSHGRSARGRTDPRSGQRGASCDLQFDQERLWRSCDSRPDSCSCSGTALPSMLAGGSETRTWFAAAGVVSTPRAGAGAEARIALNRCTTDPRSASYTRGQRGGVVSVPSDSAGPLPSFLTRLLNPRLPRQLPSHPA
jgi:hypothetical protein